MNFDKILLQKNNIINNLEHTVDNSKKALNNKEETILALQEENRSLSSDFREQLNKITELEEKLRKDKNDKYELKPNAITEGEELSKIKKK